MKEGDSSDENFKEKNQLEKVIEKSMKKSLLDKR